MKRTICLLVALVFGLSVMYPQKASADELSDLKAQMKDMMSQMQGMQDRIETLESQKASGAVVGCGPYEGGLLSVKGERFEIGGEIELEYVNTQDDAGISNDKGHFQLDKLTLAPKVYLNDDIYLYGELEGNATGAAVVKGYVNFTGLPWNSFIKVGLEDMFINTECCDNKTETHPINSTAFYRDPDLGIIAGGNLFDYDPIYWRASVTNGAQLASRSITEDGSYNIIHDDDSFTDFNQHKEVGVGLGFNKDLEEMGKIDAIGFGYFGRLSSADITYLQGVTGYGTSRDDERYKVGGTVNYCIWGFTFVGQYIHAIDGELKRSGWFLQPSYKVTIDDWDYFNGYEAVFRYNNFDVDLTNVRSDSLTWDRQTYTMAMIIDIYKNLKLKTEYSINEESTGEGQVDNNEFLMQLELKF